MKKIATLVIASFISASASAGFVDNTVPLNIFGNGLIKFGIDNAPSDTCNYHGRHFKFDATTEAGKNMLSILLAAKMANKPINIWYSASTTPGTGTNTGCSIQTLATVTEIGIKS